MWYSDLKSGESVSISSESGLDVRFEMTYEGVMVLDGDQPPYLLPIGGRLSMEENVRVNVCKSEREDSVTLGLVAPRTVKIRKEKG